MRVYWFSTFLPASPSFYGRPATLDDLLDTMVSRVLDHLGLPNELSARWGEAPYLRSVKGGE